MYDTVTDYWNMKVSNHIIIAKLNTVHQF